MALLGECKESPIQGMRKLGYPSEQMLYQRVNEDDAARNRMAGRKRGHYGSALKRDAVRECLADFPSYGKLRLSTFR